MTNCCICYILNLFNMNFINSPNFDIIIKISTAITNIQKNIYKIALLRKQVKKDNNLSNYLNFAYIHQLDYQDN